MSSSKLVLSSWLFVHPSLPYSTYVSSIGWKVFIHKFGNTCVVHWCPLAHTVHSSVSFTGVHLHIQPTVVCRSLVSTCTYSPQ
jgi:hypothetical protein